MRPTAAVESLRRMAENKATPPRKRQTLNELADLMQSLVRELDSARKRAKAMAKGRQSLELSGQPDQVAEIIADMAGDGRVTVTKKGQSVHVWRGTPSDRRRAVIGVYDEGCDMRDIADDLREMAA